MKCIVVDDDEMSRLTLTKLVDQVSSLSLIRAFSSCLEALNFLDTEKVDLILLDIEMPEMSGLEFIKSIKNPPLIILATSKKKYALESYEYNVVDFIVKPVSLDRFVKAVSKARSVFGNSEQIQKVQDVDYVFIKNHSSLVKVDTADILWIEALGDYITIHTATKKHIIHTTMKTVEGKLPSDRFIRIHRSYIISLDRINSIEDSLVVINGKLIPVGAVYKENLEKRLNLL
jgi:two-component system LytT family response regulator